MDNHKNPVNSLTLRDILPYSLFGTPIATVSKQDKIWTATAMLRFFLESLTDQLVVMDKKEPCGLIGGYDIINNVLKNPSFDLFENETVDKIMYDEFLLSSDSTKISELLQKWRQSRRAFSIIQNNSHFFAVSIRTLLGVYPFLDTDLTIHDIPKKNTIHYAKDQSVREILNLMLQNKTRRLVLENTQLYISDRIIIEKISTDLNYLYMIDDFLDMNCSIFQPAQAKIISQSNGDGYSGYTKSIVDDAQNQILKSEITIYEVDKLSKAQFETILRHELGHALGLAHSTATEDLMYPTITTDYPYISDCDVDAIVWLYDGGESSKVVCEK